MLRMESCTLASTVTLPAGQLPDGSLDVKKYYPNEMTTVTPPAGPPPSPATDAQWFKSPCSSSSYRLRSDGKIEIAGGEVPDAANDWPSAVEKWRDLIDAAASEFLAPPAFVAAVMAAESGGIPSATSPAPANAMGLMQIIPSTFDWLAGRRVSKAEAYDPAFNIRMGTKFLAQLLDKNGFNYIRVLSTYNRGSVECNPKPECADPNGWGTRINCRYIDHVFKYYNTAIDKGFAGNRVIDLGDDLQPATHVESTPAFAASVGLGLVLGALGGVAWWLARKP